MDFLESHYCALDLADAKLCTGGRSIPKPMCHKSLGSTSGGTCNCGWNIFNCSNQYVRWRSWGKSTRHVGSGRSTKKLSILVARALVTPHLGRIPMRVLNMSTEPLTIYNGTRLAKCMDFTNCISVQKDGSIWLYVNHRKITQRGAYPISRMDTLAGAKWFSMLDIKSSCWWVEWVRMIGTRLPSEHMKASSVQCDAFWAM